MVFPVFALGTSFESATDFILPDTSGLAPLELPAELTAFSQAPRNVPSEDSISRFNAAMEKPEIYNAPAAPKTPATPEAPESPRRFFANSLVVVEPQMLEEDPVEPKVVADKPVVAAKQETVVAATKPEVAVVAEKHAVVDQPKMTSEKKPVVIAVDKPVVEAIAPVAAEPVIANKPIVVVAEKPEVADEHHNDCKTKHD